mgnify:CR=1 FL=1
MKAVSTDAFIENNITFPYVIGVSAGSCNGVSFIAKNLHRMRDIMVNYAHDERYMGIKSIFKNGEYLNSKWIFGELSYEMFPLNYDEFENSKTKFCVVASNAKTGKAEYFYPTDFRKGCEIIHASCALPMATKPVQIGKDMYYDGGICDSIPLKKAYEDGCEKCVVVLTQDRHFIKKPLGHEKAIRKALHKFPLTAEAVINRQKMYNEQRKFVFGKKMLASNAKQIIFFIIRAAVNFGFYKLSEFGFKNMLDMPITFVWFIAVVTSFLFNYIYDRTLVFDCGYEAISVKQSRIYKTFYKNRYVFLSSALALLCISILYIIYSAFPFGNTTVMRMDLYHQYGPLFAELYDRIVEHKSLLYSWTTGGGSSFLGNYLNYLSSPLSFLIFLFNKEDIAFAITFIVGLKCILSATTFSYYLKSSFGKNNYYVSAFGVLYAFSAYFLAYYWNIMWLDGMIMLPLIVLGIERIFNKGDIKLYTLSMILLFFANYYMGYMSCIFAVIYFVAYFIISYKNDGKLNPNAKFEKKYSNLDFVPIIGDVRVKERLRMVFETYQPQIIFHAAAYKHVPLMTNTFINRGIKFALGSVIAAMFCAITLIPVFMILKNSSATSGTFPDTFTSYFDILDFITSHFAILETTIRSSGDNVLPNVYTGILTLILLPLSYSTTK